MSKHRIVPPAILCLIATYPLWAFFAWLTLIGIFYAGDPTALYFVFSFLELLIPGFLLVALSIMLLFDPAHHRMWGAIVAVFYGLATTYSALIFYSVLFDGGISSFPTWIAMVAAASPPLGLIGGFWSILWKPPGQQKQESLQKMAQNRTWELPSGES